MKFTKMHGLGNDYVYINGFEEKLYDPAAVSIAVSDRHFGIGADGLIMILPSEVADVRMRMFNADGSEGQMCGNGIRCVAKYSFDHGLTQANPMRVETLAGIKTIDLQLNEEGKVASATVDMGEPILEGKKIPSTIDEPKVVDYAVEANGETYNITLVSMGNPHAIIYTDNCEAVELEKIGAVLETLPEFPERMNVHFVQVHSPAELTMRTWERGSGITLACGTGASAVCVAGVLNNKNDRETLIHLPGGDLNIRWDEASNHVFMTGTATEVFTGIWGD